MSQLMQGFPPGEAVQVTLANWRSAPFSRWAFHHVREIVPSAEIAHDPATIAALPEAPGDLGLEDFIAATDTDAIVVLHHGKVVLERYAHSMTRESPHILMSVSK